MEEGERREKETEIIRARNTNKEKQEEIKGTSMKENIRKNKREVILQETEKGEIKRYIDIITIYAIAGLHSFISGNSLQRVERRL